MKSADFDTCARVAPRRLCMHQSRSIAITTVTDYPVQLSRCAGIAASRLQHQRGSWGSSAVQPRRWVGVARPVARALAVEQAQHASRRWRPVDRAPAHAGLSSHEARPRPHARRRRGLPARAHRASARVRIQRASTSASDEVFLERPSRRPVSDRAAVRPHRQPLAAESANDWKGGGKTSQKQIPTASDPTRTLLNCGGGLAADRSLRKGLTPT